MLVTRTITAILLLFLVWIIGYSCTSDDHPEVIIESRRALGQRLFFDPRLSYNNTKSCSSCHDPRFAFTDGYRRSITASGDIVLHNAPSLINAGSLHYFDWANTSVNTLLHQSDRPLYNTSPIELGVKGNEQTILARIGADEYYGSAFYQSFPGQDPVINLANIQLALAAFTVSIQSMNAAYDRFVAGDSTAMTASAKAGMILFLSNELSCRSCHPPPYFTNAAMTKNIDSVFFNTGLYNISNTYSYPADDPGLQAITGNPMDNGRFKIPTLRNIALTAPYTHDGSVNTISEMIDIYSRGGREIKNGPQAGDGLRNSHKSSFLDGFSISAKEKSELIDFLFALTDSTVISNPAFTDPSRQSLK